MIKVNCNICNKEQNICASRARNYKTCSKDCLKKYKQSLNDLNCTCTNCNIKFHLKPSQKKKYNRNMGEFCSMKCSTEYKKNFYKGKNNPNYRGKQYDNDGYRINHYPKIGRIKEHHYIVLNYLKLDKIPKGYVVHHRDCNIYNNVPENLCLLSPSDHRWLHKQFGNATLWAYCNNKISYSEIVSWSNDPERCKIIQLNLINQSGVFKQGELLETPEMDNQQPSLGSNTFEGSTTNSRILPSDVEDSNADSSALLGYKKSESKLIGVNLTLKDGSEMFISNDDIV